MKINSGILVHIATVRLLKTYLLNCQVMLILCVTIERMLYYTKLKISSKPSTTYPLTMYSSTMYSMKALICLQYMLDTILKTYLQNIEHT